MWAINNLKKNNRSQRSRKPAARRHRIGSRYREVLRWLESDLGTVGGEGRRTDDCLASACDRQRSVGILRKNRLQRGDLGRIQHRMVKDENHGAVDIGAAAAVE